MLLENIYKSEPNVLINEEIDLIYEMSTHPTQPESELEKCIKFFLFGLFESKTDDKEKTGILINKIFHIAKLKRNLMATIIKELEENLKSAKNSYLSLKLLGKFICQKDEKEPNEQQPDLNDEENAKEKSIFLEGILSKSEIVDLFVKNFKDFKSFVKSLIQSKNWNNIFRSYWNSFEVF